MTELDPGYLPWLEFKKIQLCGRPFFPRRPVPTGRAYTPAVLQSYAHRASEAAATPPPPQVSIHTHHFAVAEVFFIVLLLIYRFIKGAGIPCWRCVPDLFTHPCFPLRGGGRSFAGCPTSGTTPRMQRCMM
jgi:hypothetical protein